MAGPVFPDLPQTAAMRATDGTDVDPSSARFERREKGELSPSGRKAASQPIDVKSSSGRRAMMEEEVGKRVGVKSPTGSGRGKESRQDHTSNQKKSSRAPRPPTKPTGKESSGVGAQEDSTRPSLSAKKIAKLRKRFARASVDVNVELDPTGRFTRSNQVLGKGSSKVVYKGFDRHQGMEIAWNQVKIPGNLTPRAKARLMNEIEVLKRLKHKSIMKFYTSWIDMQQNHLNFITEYFHPGPLRRHRRAHKCMPRIVLKRWAWQILQGLVYLHGHSPPIIHRDLKCDNIFIHGVTGEVKIGDLGLAKLMEEGLSTCQSVLGTPEFMAPELYHGIYNEKVDIYAYGMCLLELVSMQFPYMECQNRAQIFRHVSMGIHPASLAKIEDTECREFIELCINHFHERRPSARELVKHAFFDDIRNCNPSTPLQNHLPLRKGEQPKVSRIKKAEQQRTFELQRKEVMPHSTKLKLELNMVSGNATKLFMFQFDLETDTIDAVAMELQEEFGLTHEETQQFIELLTGEVGNRIEEERRDTMRDIKASLGPLENLTGSSGEEGQVIGAVKDTENLSECSSQGYEEEDGGKIPDWALGGIGQKTEENSHTREVASGLAGYEDEGVMSPVAPDAYGNDCRSYDIVPSQHGQNNPFCPRRDVQDAYADDVNGYSPTPCRPGRNNPFAAKRDDIYDRGMDREGEQYFNQASQFADAYARPEPMQMNGHYGMEKPIGYINESAPPSSQYMNRMMPSPSPSPGPYSAGSGNNGTLKAYRGIETVPRHPPPEKPAGCSSCSPWCGSFWEGAKGAWNVMSPWGPGKQSTFAVSANQRMPARAEALPVGSNVASRFRKSGSIAHLVATMSHKERPRRR